MTNTIVSVIASSAAIVAVVVGAVWRLSTQIAEIRILIADAKGEQREWTRSVIRENIAAHHDSCRGAISARMDRTQP